MLDSVLLTPFDPCPGQHPPQPRQVHLGAPPYAADPRQPPRIVGELHRKVVPPPPELQEKSQECEQAGPGLPRGPDREVVYVGIVDQYTLVRRVDQGRDMGVGITLAERMHSRRGEQSVAY